MGYFGIITEGYETGEFKEYHRTGKIFLEGEYINGYIYGKEYDCEERLFEGQFNLNKEKLNGKGKEYDEKGELIFNGQYKNGKKWNGETKINYYKYNKGKLIGNQIFEGVYINGKKKGILKRFNEKGDLIFYYDGKTVIEYDNKGNKIFEVKYTINKKKNGLVIEYDNKGYKIFEGEYLNGMRHGKGTEYNLKGNIVFKGEYFNEKRWNGIEYEHKGNTVFEQEIRKGEKNGNIIMKEYYKK